MNRFFRVLFLVGVLWMIFLSDEAHAYIDPGSGSFFLQVALAALISSLVAVKMFWRNIKGFFRRKLGRPAKHSSHDQ